MATTTFAPSGPVTWGSELAARDEDGDTAFLRACRKGDAASIAALGRSGCDKAARDKHGRTALMAAAVTGSAAAVQAELDLGGAELEARDKMGRTALHVACGRGAKRRRRTSTAALR